MTDTNDIVKRKVPVSILIPIKNEAANLPRCLQAVTWADEILVVDSHSTDGSQAIAESFGARVIQFDFSGTWQKRKTGSLDSLSFRNEWVFILDADEVLPASAESEFNNVINQSNVAGGEEIRAYWINRRFFFLGKWLRHAYYPNWNIRLFKHKYGRYEKLTDIDTASGDNEVHEHVIVDGKTAYLKCEMDHYAFPSVDVFVEKHNRYSNWEARVAVDEKERGSVARLQKSPVGIARLLRHVSRYLPFRPLLRFLYVYIWQKGFLDGIEGYYFACLHAYYEFLVVVKTYELRQGRK